MISLHLYIRIFLASVILKSIYATLAFGLAEQKFKGKYPLKEVRRGVASAGFRHKLHRRQGQQCFPNIECKPNTAYRTIDGTCNNLDNPFWGAWNIPYSRILTPDYGDGSSSPRGSSQVPPLPSSRKVSVAMTNTPPTPVNSDITLMVMQWGQFIDHDMVLTDNAGGTGYDGSACCADFINSNPDKICDPIDVVGDPFYDSKKVRCLPFIRSAENSCDSGPMPKREQTNMATAYLDASQVYGPDQTILDKVRDPTNQWRLAIGNGNEQGCSVNCPLSFLPEHPGPPPLPPNPGSSEVFTAGDDRVEIQPGLTSMHTLFLRLHNGIADIIRSNNPPSISDEQIFQETRKICGALIQQITYSEFLPLVLGNTIMNTNGLTLEPINSPNPYFTGYDPNVEASIQNVFAAASFRFGHSLISDTFALPTGLTVELRKSYNNHLVTLASDSYPSDFLRGMCTQNAEKMDQILVDAVHNYLLAVSPFDFGSDLYARNIKRGRDHGIPSYLKWLEECTGITITSWADLYTIMPQQVADALDVAYDGRLEDIDLFPAGIAEMRVSDGLIGPTFACLNAKNFLRLKVGDRFWFENPNVFETDKLQSIRLTTLASIICKYTDATKIQEKVMQPIDGSNPVRNCDDINTLGLMNDVQLYWSNLSPTL